MKELVSIIIPIYNAELYLNECLDSVLNQNYHNIEVICVNDGSIDKSKDIINYYKKIDKRIISIECDNKGVSSARNLGIKHSKGKFICFVDADDVIGLNFIDTLVRIMKNECEYASVGIKSISENECKFFSEGKTKYFNIIDGKIGLFNEYGGYLANKMYLARIIKCNNLYFDTNLRMSEDLFFNYTYLDLCRKGGYNDGIKYNYIQHRNSAVNNLNNNNWFDILKVYNRIIKNEKNEKVTNAVCCRYLFLLYEGKYRKKHMNQSYLEIDKLIKKYLPLRKYFSKKDNIKLSLFSLFPAVVMKYKRRYL